MIMENLLGSILVFIISFSLKLRFKELSFFLVVSVSVVAGTFYSNSIADGNKWVLAVVLFHYIVSLFGIESVKLSRYIKSKLIKMNNSVEGFFLNDEDLTEEEKKELNEISSENMYVVATLVLGGAGFLFDPQLLSLPIITLLFGILTSGTLDKSRGHNPWTFYMGMTFSIAGIVLHQIGYVHI